MEKTMKARVQHKHDIEANWLKATNFIPLASEIIVYDPDENYDYPRIKIGDGKTNINTLPFVTKDYAKISDIPTKPEDIGALPGSTVIPTVPTKISAFENDKGYLTQHQSLDAYAKTADLGALATKDSLTASDVGALPDTTKIPSTLADLTADSTHRTVTDAEKETWNVKSNFSGNYADLNGKPTIPTVPTKISAFENDAKYLTTFTETDPTVPDWAKAKEKPTYTADEVGALPDSTEIPSKLSDLDEDTTHRLVTDTEKATWNAKSNFSGSYNDLTDKPTIPSIAGLASTTYVDDAVKNKVEKDGNKVLSTNDYTTAEKNKLANIAAGAEVNVNADWNATSGDAQILNKPTLVSAFTNDAGYLTEHQSLAGLATESYVNNQIAAIPTPDVSGQINNHNIATDTHNDIRLLINGLTTRLNTLANSDDTTLDQMSEVVAYIKNNKSLIEGITNNKVNVSDIINNLTTNVSNKPLSAAQGVALKALIDAIVVPTKVSQLENDSKYLTSFTETDPTVPAWAKASSKPSYTKSEVGLGNVDNTSDANKPVSTAQASAIADAKKAGTDAQTNLNAHANNKSNPHGVTKTQVGLSNVDNVKQYSAENPPVVVQSGAPVDTSVIWVDPNDNSSDEFSGGDAVRYVKQTLTDTQKAQARENIDAMSQDDLQSGVNTALAQAKASGEFDGKDGLDATPVTPLFANSVDECTDTTKLYVLPDGFIYAYMYQEATGPSYTNLSETVNENYRIGSSGTLSALTGAVTTDFIPAKKGQTIRFKGFDPTVMPESKFPYICFYTSASESAKVSTGVWDRLDWMIDGGHITKDDSGAYVYTAFVSTENNKTNPYQHPLADSITHIRMCGSIISGQTVIVTVDEEIIDGGSSGGYEWVSTGHAFVPADYEAEILALQKNKADKTAIPTKLPNPNALTIDGVPYDGSSAVNIETQSGGNILYGKKWVACGDSFTHGGYNTSDGFDESVYIYQSGRFAGHNIVYPYIIGLRNNMNIVNLATGGQTMAQSSNSFMSRYTTIDADADYITIMLGINDKVQGLAVGNLEDSTNTTFCGAFNIAMEYILENHPFAHIGIMVSHGTNEEIMEATRGIAERWGVPYLDYGSPQVPLMNRYTGRNVCAKAQEIREKNFCIASDSTTPTNGHPNTAAHEFESTFIEAWLRTL